MYASFKFASKQHDMKMQYKRAVSARDQVHLKY